MLPAAPASATPPASESQAAVLARMGDEARVAGRFTEAEASYRAALAIAPCDRTELSLALALAAQGKAREAAPILARVLRKAANETPGNPPQGAPRASPESGPRGTQESAPREAAPAGGLSQTERERAARALADAQRELATITVDADVPGALVEVDGAQVGMSPLTEPVFVGPGRHTVRAARDGHQASQAVFDAEVGRTYAVHLALPRDATADSAPGAGPQADARDARRAAGRAGPRSLPEEVSPPAAGSYLSGPGGAVRAAGITLTAAGVLAGVSALVAAEVKSSHLAGQSAALGQDPGKCWEAKGAVAEACARLESGIAARDTMATAASVLFAGSGVAAAATFLSFFLLPPSRPVGTRLGGLDFTLSPHAGPRGGGVSLEASW